MATDVFDEHRFSSQMSLYEPTRTRLSNDTTRHARTGSSTTVFETSSTNSISRPQRVKYSFQQNSTTNNSNQQRNSGSNDLISLFRTFAIKPFRTSSMINTGGEGQINNQNNNNNNNTLTGNQAHGKTNISLLKYRPLSENVSDPTPNIQPTRVCIEKRKKSACANVSRIIYQLKS